MSPVPPPASGGEPAPGGGSELARRVRTAALLLPAAVAAVLWLPTPVFSLALALAALAGAWEWIRLSGWEEGAARRHLAAFALAVGLLGWGPPGPEALAAAAWGAVLWWTAVAGWLAAARGALPAPPPRLLRGLASWPTLLPAWLLLTGLHGAGPRGPALALGVMALVWAADTGAYFAGRRWGRRRLAPGVSPGKSWEGVAGGLAAAGALAILEAPLLGLPTGGWLLVASGAAGCSVVGDLLESALKRWAGAKDSGRLLPGHGGVLDRIDGLLAAVPAAYAGLLLLEGLP